MKRLKMSSLHSSLPAALVSVILVTIGCSDGSDTPGETVDAAVDIERPDKWGEDTHGADAEPDYEGLFNDELGSMKVHRFDLIIDQETYDRTMADLEGIYGTCGSGGGPGGGPGGGETEKPVWVPIEVRHEGNEWTKVGMRYKGNSSLKFAWRDCVKKLAFRLDFDQFENDFPEVHDQRFYGFKKMTFSSGFGDSSLIRDKLAADMFRRAGIPAARGGFAEVYATIGEQAPQYFGMYTMIEDPTNRMLDSQFDDDGGNLYKPESQFGAGVSGTALEMEFEKKTNDEQADWSDVSALLAALHADTRQSDPTAWRASLEQHLDVPSFLRWYAINQAMVNWDTYGCLAHNYYLYADPSDPTEGAPNGRFTWFPWDLNLSLLNTGICSFSDAEGLIPDATQIGSDWPLLRYLLDDVEYAANYRNELQKAIESTGAVDAPWVKERIAAYHDLISPYVIGPNASEQPGYTFLSNQSAFTDSDSSLQSFIDDRVSLVNDVLGQ